MDKRIILLMLGSALPAMGKKPGFKCSDKDHPSDCAGLEAIAMGLNFDEWTRNDKWGKDDKSVCTWEGITCDSSGRVSELDLKENNCKGVIPDGIGNLTELTLFHIEGGRPQDYQGCSGTDLGKTSLPNSFFTLTKLTDVNLEYSCLGGTLEGFGNLSSLVSLQVHGNYISGSIPQEMEALKDIVILKLGRNPLSGTLPLFKTFSKVIQFNCNFCALTGEFPDFFQYTPSLQVSYWDGNGFTGSLPASIGKAKNLTRLSFNINQFSGKIPASICDIPAGEGGDTPDTSHDCRIGSDINLTAYQANYPWIVNVTGNRYDCSAGVPSCAVHGSCNKTVGVKVINPVSPVKCQ